MTAKIAMSFITYNRSKHIREDLQWIAKATQKKGIDIYIFDGSTDDKTEKVVRSFVDRGHQHIQYFHYEDTVDGQRQRMKDALFLPDAEYLWFCGDKFIVSPKNYDSILRYIEKSMDIITIYSASLHGTRSFQDPVKYVEYSAIPLTHYGATIIRKELLNENCFNFSQRQPSFWRFIMYICAIDKNDFSGVTIDVPQKRLQLVSRYNTESISKSKMWDIWIKGWYGSVMCLPKRYDEIKYNLLNRPDKDMHFFSLKQLLYQRMEGQFNWGKYKEYKQYVSSVVMIPNTVVCLISILHKNIVKIHLKLICVKDIIQRKEGVI